MKAFKAGFTALIAILAITGCGSSVKLTDPPPVIEAHGNQPVQPEIHRVCCARPDSRSELDDPQSILSKRSIYFDYDMYLVADTFKPIVEAHGRYLAAHKDAKVMLQGNADERGSREYNLALGQKRSEAVRKAFMLYGATEAQLEAVSFGSERPKADGSNERAWAENRRVDIVYQ